MDYSIVIVVAVAILALVVGFKIADRRRSKELHELRASWEEAVVISSEEIEAKQQALAEAELRTQRAEEQLQQHLRAQDPAGKTVWKCRLAAQRCHSKKGKEDGERKDGDRGALDEEEGATTPTSDSGVGILRPLTLKTSEREGRHKKSVSVPNAAHLAKKYKSGRTQLTQHVDLADAEFTTASGYQVMVCTPHPPRFPPISLPETVPRLAGSRCI